MKPRITVITIGVDDVTNRSPQGRGITRKVHKEATLDIDFAVSYYAGEVRNMFSNYSKTNHSQDKVSANDASGPKKKTVADNEAACRCKETAAMSPGQLLKLMVGDLASWVRAKKK